MTAPTPLLAPHLGHAPVMLAEVLEALAPADGEVFVDATFGRGGYARALLAAARCRVIGIDRDGEAIAAGRALAAEASGRLELREGPFGRLDDLVGELVAGPVDGVAFDLGVSSPQLDDPARGFSFRADGPLDMRMGRDGTTAAELVASLPEAELGAIIRDLGEERHWRRLAAAIVRERRARPIATTLALAAVIRRVVPRAKDGIDPATRAFQGLRIAVNDELGELDRGLCAAERLLRPGGRLAVVAFHSLEDRRVKRFLAERSGSAPGVSRHAPVPRGPARAPTFRLARRRPLMPGAAEAAANPRAASARLRSAVRTDAPAWVRPAVEGTP